MARTPDQGRSVLSKVAAVLESFTPTTPRLSLNELARHAGLPVSTTYRIARELAECGALERVDQGGYRIGLRLWELGSLAPRGLSVREVAAPFMQDLYDATHENVHLAVLDGTEALYIETITGRQAVPVKSRRGGRLSLHATGVGKVLLAYSPEEFVDNILRAGLKRHTAHTIIAPGHLKRALAEVRRTGVAFAREEMTIGTLSVAAPIIGPQENVVAAVAVVLRPGRTDLRKLAPAVRTTAISISRALRQHSVDITPIR